MNDEAEYKKILEKAMAAGRAAAAAQVSSHLISGGQGAASFNSSSAKPARKRNGPKNINKVMSGKQLAKHAGASAWRTALSDLGYLKKGSQFKRIPEKNSAEYNKIKALQKAYENKSFK